MFPFGTSDNEALLNLFDYDKPCIISTLPSFEITSHLNNLPNLQDYDIDEHLPSNSEFSIHNATVTETFARTGPSAISSMCIPPCLYSGVLELTV